MNVQPLPQEPRAALAAELVKQVQLLDVVVPQNLANSWDMEKNPSILTSYSRYHESLCLDKDAAQVDGKSGQPQSHEVSRPAQPIEKYGLEAL